MCRTKMLTLLIFGGSASAVFAQSSIRDSLYDNNPGCCLRCWEPDSRKPERIGGIAIESTRVDGVVASTATSVNTFFDILGNRTPATIGGISIQASDVKGRLSAITITTDTADTVVAGRGNYSGTKVLSQNAEPLLEKAGVGEKKQSLAEEAVHSTENAQPLASAQGKALNLAPLALTQIYAGEPASIGGIVITPIKPLTAPECKIMNDGPVLAAPFAIACLGGITPK